MIYTNLKDKLLLKAIGTSNLEAIENYGKRFVWKSIENYRKGLKADQGRYSLEE